MTSLADTLVENEDEAATNEPLIPAAVNGEDVKTELPFMFIALAVIVPLELMFPLAVI
jgi:hypothetical protein